MTTVFKRILKEEAGQAVVEYILILTVAIGVILGGLYQLNDAVRVWADNYFGDYLACLIETGELPALGGSSGGECNQSYEPFSLANGRPPSDTGAGGGGSDPSDSSEGPNGTSGQASGGGGSGRPTIVSSSNNFSDTRNSRFRANRGAGSESEDEESSKTGSASVTNISGYDSARSVRIPVKRYAAFKNGKIKKNNDDKDNERGRFAVKSSEKGEKKQNELIPVNRKLASDEAQVEIEEFTFGRLFRYLLIAAIIIAVVFFIGGQILQVSKSMD